MGGVHGVHEHSMSSLSSTPHGVPMECSWTPCRMWEIQWTAHGLLMDCSWSSWEGVGECKVLLPPNIVMPFLQSPEIKT